MSYQCCVWPLFGAENRYPAGFHWPGDPLTDASMCRELNSAAHQNEHGKTHQPGLDDATGYKHRGLKSNGTKTYAKTIHPVPMGVSVAGVALS